MKVIDLFAGAGGLSEGFRQEGYDVLAHVEMDKSACNTLRTREAYYHLKDINKLNIYKDYLTDKINRDELYESIPKNILNRVIESEINTESISGIFQQVDDLIGKDKVDIIIGGPPCQAYSTAGISRDPNRMKDDPRNYLYLFYIKFLDRYSPNIFIFENVKGLLTAKKGEIFNNLKRKMKDVGYELDYQILNAKTFGVAQSRERVIIIGWKKELQFKYPEFPSNSMELTIKELFNDLPSLQSGQEKNGMGMYQSEPSKIIKHLRDADWNILVQHISRKNNENDLKIYKLVIKHWNQTGKNLKYNELPEELITHKNRSSFLDRYKMVQYDSFSHTIVAHISKDGHYYIHPDINQNRSLTVREAARIQSFPDDFYFEDSRTAAFKQIGNAVPPLMAKAIASNIREFLINKKIFQSKNI